MPNIASGFILNTLLGQFTNISSIYQLYKPIMCTSIQLLQIEPVLDKLSTADGLQPQRSLPPFLADALQWSTVTATTKDTTEIKWQINLLMQEQTKQQVTLVHIISILNITYYATQVNSINVSAQYKIDNKYMSHI